MESPFHLVGYQTGFRIEHPNYSHLQSLISMPDFKLRRARYSRYPETTRNFVRLSTKSPARSINRVGVYFHDPVALISGLYGTFAMYQKHGIMGESAKMFYNTLVTGLSMTLGINIASSFKAIAVDVRWWILSRKKRSIEEVCLQSTVQSLITQLQ
jgi:hypothetical protein